MKKISLLGSTGSIGTQCLDIVRENREEYQVEAITCGSNANLLAEQIREFQPKMAVTAKEEDALELQKQFPAVEFYHGAKGLVEAAKVDCDMVVNGLMGMRGLEPTYHAVMKGTDIALANKETLVAGGEVVMAAVKEKGVKMLPVDSEHSAIFQSLEGNEGRKINKILLTASGGPFRGYTLEQLENVTLEQALKHPNWSMGQKITIDSASMMNKGLEVIEAKWLFDVDADKIQVVVHPQSIVHSAVQFQDGAVKAQLGAPDMRVPIQLAMSYPVRLESSFPRLDWWDMQDLTFERPDLNRFPCLALAYESIRLGGNAACIVNAANEVVNLAFRQDKCGFLQMADIISECLSKVPFIKQPTLEDYLETDRITRIAAAEML